MIQSNALWSCLITITALPAFAVAEEPKSATSRGEQVQGPPTEFDKYALVLLKRGRNWSAQRTAASEQIQKEHLAHLRRLSETGKLVVAGPFGDQSDPSLRGMCLYRVESLREAKALAQADPAVRAGRLEAEVMTWYVEKGRLAFPKADLPSGG